MASNSLGEISWKVRTALCLSRPLLIQHVTWSVVMLNATCDCVTACHMMVRWPVPMDTYFQYGSNAYMYHIYKIIVVCPSVHYGRSAEMIWLRDTRWSISGYRRLEARARRFLCVSVIALATDKNTSVLDGLYKNQATMGTYIQRPADS